MPSQWPQCGVTGPTRPDKALTSASEGVPAAQDDHRVYDRSDQSCTLSRAIPVYRSPEEGRDNTPHNAQYGRQHEALRLFGEGEIQRAMNPAMAPITIAQMICMLASLEVSRRSTSRTGW